MTYRFIKTNIHSETFSIILNRPAVHNALNMEMVQEMIHAVTELEQHPGIRAVVLRGEGPSFCAGGDIGFLAAAHGSARLPAFAEKLQELLFELVHCRLPVVSLAKGSVFGGALGLLAASDIVVSASDARFSFSETRIGMVPAAILPFINKRIGTTNSRYLMLTAKVFDPMEARHSGLVNAICEPHQLEESLDEILGQIRQSSPEASMLTKQIINAIDNRNVLIDSASYSINFYKNINQSPWVAEGLKAFVEKRKPSWLEPGKHAL